MFFPKKLATPPDLDHLDEVASCFVSYINEHIIHACTTSGSTSMDSICVIDSNIWMNDKYEDFLYALNELLVLAKKQVTCIGSQLDEIENKKSNSDSHEARHGLRMLEGFQKSGVLNIVGVRASAKRDAYADPEIISLLNNATKGVRRTSLMTDDRALRMRARSLVEGNFEIIDILKLLPMLDAYRSVRSMYFNVFEWYEFTISERTRTHLKQRNDDAFFVFRSAHSGKVVDLPERKHMLSFCEPTLDRSIAQQWDYWGGRNQIFLISYDPSNSNTVFIRAWNGSATGWWAYLAANGRENGAEAICQREPYPWELVKYWDGTWEIKSVECSRVLDIEAASTENGAKLHLWDSHEGRNQRWKIQSCGSLKEIYLWSGRNRK